MRVAGTTRRRFGGAHICWQVSRPLDTRLRSYRRSILTLGLASPLVLESRVAHVLIPSGVGGID